MQTVATKIGKPQPWPNGLGWDVPTRHGVAEVRNLVTRLRVFLPLEPEGKQDRFRVLDVPISTEPASAVAMCKTAGAIRYEGFHLTGIPTVERTTDAE